VPAGVISHAEGSNGERCRGAVLEYSPCRKGRAMMNLGDTGRSARQANGTANGTQRVVIVNGSADTLELLESVLDAGHYDISFVQSGDHAYSQIRQMQPNLVILCIRIEDVAGFQVLSMLKLDEETQRIPVLTYTTEYEGQDVQLAESPEEDDTARPSTAGRILRVH
jgi:PleD family two-component response regulator